MICKVCGYKLTQLFTSIVCDRCDGLVPAAEVHPPAFEVKEDPNVAPGWIVIRCNNGPDQYIPFFN
jgi:hypothetical protein